MFLKELEFLKRNSSLNGLLLRKKERLDVPQHLGPRHGLVLLGGGGEFEKRVPRASPTVVDLAERLPQGGDGSDSSEDGAP